MEAESAITQVGEMATTRSASPAIARIKSHPAVNQRKSGPAAPQPAQPAKPAVQTEMARSQKRSQGASFPTTSAVAEPPDSLRRLLKPPSRHSRASMETKARSAPSAMRPGTKVGSR